MAFEFKIMTTEELASFNATASAEDKVDLDAIKIGGEGGGDTPFQEGVTFTFPDSVDKFHIARTSKENGKFGYHLVCDVVIGGVTKTFWVSMLFKTKTEERKSRVNAGNIVQSTDTTLCANAEAIKADLGGLSINAGKQWLVNHFGGKSFTTKKLRTRDGQAEKADGSNLLKFWSQKQKTYFVGQLTYFTFPK